MTHYKYEPLTNNEQEVLQRMIEGQDVYVEVESWGYHPAPQMTAGDKRLQVRFPLTFTRPTGGIIAPVTQLRLHLKMRDGRTIFSDTKSVCVNYKPLPVSAGLQIDLIWDIALDRISAEFQSLIMPGIRGKKAMSIRNGEVVSE
jgi:hypothetical protein